MNDFGSISPCFEYKKDGTTQIREELNIFLEEEDTWLIPNICYNTLNGYKWIAAISNDTDVFALILHYMTLLFDKRNKWIAVKIGHW